MKKFGKKDQYMPDDNREVYRAKMIICTFDLECSIMFNPNLYFQNQAL